MAKKPGKNPFAKMQEDKLVPKGKGATWKAKGGKMKGGGKMAPPFGKKG